MARNHYARRGGEREVKDGAILRPCDQLEQLIGGAIEDVTISQVEATGAMLPSIVVAMPNGRRLVATLAGDSEGMTPVCVDISKIRTAEEEVADRN